MPSQINVDILAPVSFGTVDINGALISSVSANNSLRISNSQSTVVGISNTILGVGSGLPTGQSNTLVGSLTGSSLTSGAQNTYVGTSSGQNTTTGNGNTYVGRFAGLSTTTGSSNVAVGSQAGQTVTGLLNGVFIGASSGTGMSNITGNNVVCIGASASPSASAVFDEITLGSSSIATLRCAVTSITSLSDARDKKEVIDLRVGLDFLKGLRPVEFVWDDRDENGKHDIADFGFLAQDLKAAQEDVKMAEVLKLVYESNPEKLEASYGKLIPVLVQAIKDLAAKVETLENKKK